jgi:hypothetical protein
MHLCTVNRTALTLVAIIWRSLRACLAALAIVGTGFGIYFYGVLIVSAVSPEERGELFASLFTLSYLAFDLPTRLTYMATGTFVLTSMALRYGALIVLLSAAAGLLREFGTGD